MPLDNLLAKIKDRTVINFIKMIREARCLSEKLQQQLLCGFSLLFSTISFIHNSTFKEFFSIIPCLTSICCWNYHWTPLTRALGKNLDSITGSNANPKARGVKITSAPGIIIYIKEDLVGILIQAFYSGYSFSCRIPGFSDLSPKLEQPATFSQNS